MKKTYALIVICVLLISCGSAGGGGGNVTGGSTAPTNATALAEEVFNLINNERAAEGLAALLWHAGLYDLAMGHANDMCDRTYFDHNNPEGDGPWERAQNGTAGAYTFDIVAPPFTGIGENIAQGPTDSATVMQGWMNSAGHRANILDPDWTHVAAGYVECPGDPIGPYWIQIFGL